MPASVSPARLSSTSVPPSAGGELARRSSSMRSSAARAVRDPRHIEQSVTPRVVRLLICSGRNGAGSWLSSVNSVRRCVVAVVKHAVGLELEAGGLGQLADAGAGERRALLAR